MTTHSTALRQARLIGTLPPLRALVTTGVCFVVALLALMAATSLALNEPAPLHRNAAALVAPVAPVVNADMRLEPYSVQFPGQGAEAQPLPEQF
jgi:hypothetical protein